MEFTVMRPAKVDISTIKVQARVRYPEDTAVYDGMVWIEDNNENPIMPCMVSVDQRGCKIHSWCPEIDVNTGIIKNWTKGFRADACEALGELLKNKCYHIRQFSSCVGHLTNLY